MVNAFVDHGSCRVSECLAKIFANNNWFMLQCSESKINHVLAKCLPDLNYLLQHYHALFSCVLQTIGVT